MGSVGLEPADFLEPEIVIQLGYPPYRIDLITSASGVVFNSCWDRRLTVTVGSVEAGLISYPVPSHISWPAPSSGHAVRE